MAQDTYGILRGVSLDVWRSRLLIARESDNIRTLLMGRRVRVKRAVNGISNRPGTISDVTVTPGRTTRVTVGVKLDRLDGRSLGQLDPIFVGVEEIRDE
jgi:hypothetical protein